MVEQLDIHDWWSNQRKKTQYIQQQTSQVICRIFFVRHGRTDVESESPQLPDTELSEEWIAEMHALAKRLKKLWANRENTLLLCRPGENNEMKRIVESKEILEQYDIGKYEPELLLDTTEKIEIIDQETWKKQIKSTKEHHNASGNKYSEAGILMESIRTKEQYSAYKNIILLGHKSNDAILEILQGKKEKEETVLNPWRVETWVIYEWDLNADKEYSNYEKQKDILHINNKNITGIVNVLRQEEWLRGYIEAFFKKELEYFELQNVVNKYFGDHQELYEKYLASENSELMVFCLANLIQRENNKIIEDNFSKAINALDKNDFNEKAKTIWNILSQSKEKLLSYTDLFLRTLYVDGKIDDHLSSYIKAQVKDKQEILTQIEYYESLMKHHEKHIQPNISEIRNKSLDERFHTKKDNKEIDNNFNLWDKDIEENCLHILDNNQTVVIEWDWWSGKSFFSVYFQEQLKKKYFTYNNTSYFPIYIQLSGKEWNKVKEEIKEQEKYLTDTKKKKIYIFESLDESKFCNVSGIKTFLEHIQQNDLKSIINTRAWYVNTSYGEGKNIKKYRIWWMKDSMRYVEDCFDGNKKLIEKYKQLQDQIGEEYTQENSLFVTILCELIQEWGEGLEKIDSKWKLFDAIVEQRLSKWEWEKEGRKIDVNTKKEDTEIKKQIYDEIRKRSSILEKIAYLKHKKRDKIEEKDIYSIADVDTESLSFLFKKNDKWEYGFIHKSFERYFLLRYFKENPEVLDEVRKKPQEPDNSRWGRLKRKLQELYIIKYDKWDIDENSKENLLEVAVTEGYIEMAEFLRTQWYDINKKHWSWKTPFMLAFESWKREMVKWLADNVDNIQEREIYGKSVFVWACEEGRLDVVQLLVNKTINTNIKGKGGKTGFMIACEKWELEIAQFLEDKIEDINEKDNKGNTAFMLACRNWKLDVAKRLEDKTNINERDNDGTTAFMWACDKWELETVQWLTNRINDINEKDNEWRCALLMACAAWKLKIVEWLLDKIDNINVKDNSWMNPLMWACLCWWLEIAQLIVNKTDNINERDNDGNTAFLWACRSKNLELVKWLYDKEIDIHEKDNYGRNAFMLACKKWRLEIAKWLTDKVNINEKDNDWQTAFMLACENWELETVQWLTDEINNINEKDNDGKSAFLYACAAWKIKIVEWLAKKIEDINEEDNDWTGAFIRACINWKLELVQWLFDKVNDVNKKDKKGMTAFMRANTGNRPETVQRLSERVNINEKDNKWHTAFMWASLSGNIWKYQWDWNKKTNINERDNEWRTAFIRACLKWELQAARCIEREIEDINEKDNDGNTAFMWACRNWKLETAKWLLKEKVLALKLKEKYEIKLTQRLSKKKININEKDNNGNTAFIWACKNWELETAKWLCDKWVNITKKNNLWMNALMLACLYGNLDIVIWLMDKIRIKDKDNQWMTVFMRACVGGNLEIMNILYSKIHNINEKDNGGNTVFIWACLVWNLEVVQWLFDKVNINERDNEWRTAFVWACLKWNLEIVKRLGEKIDINEKDNDGNTAFMRACTNWHVEVAEFLYDKIEDTNQENIYGANALTLAAWNWELEIIKWFSEKTKDVNEIATIIILALKFACSEWYIALAERSLKMFQNTDEDAINTTVINALKEAISIAEEHWQIDVVDMIQEKIEQLKQFS